MTKLNQKLSDALNAALARQKGIKLNGKRCRDKTDIKHRDVVRAAYGRLQVLGFGLENPANIQERHLKALVQDWAKSRLANTTMANNRSRLSIFFIGIGKSKGFFKPLASYLPGVDPKSLKVKAAATKSKSWSELGIDIHAKLREAAEIDRTGCLVLILGTMLMFGLRRREALSSYPWKAGAIGGAWQVFMNEGKNARPRFVMIQSAEQQMWLDHVRSKLKKHARLRWDYTPMGKEPSLAWAEQRFNYFMRRLGLTKLDAGATGHGLRNQFAENSAIVMQFVPPVLGGTGGETDRDEMRVRKSVVSELLGHAKLEKTGAYYGRSPRHPVPMTIEEYAEAFKAGIAEVERSELVTAPPIERRDDCKRICMLMLDFQIGMSLAQAFALWRIHSERHAVPWVVPQTDGEIIAAIYVASTKHIRREGPR